MSSVPARDERRHPSGPEQLWGESWYFDFVAPDGSLGGCVRLGLHPHTKEAWFWAALVGVGRRLVTVRDHDVAPPRGEALEIRAGALWSMFNCETPLDHWSMGLEAYAVALDDPTEAYRGERGDRVGLGFDLEWEAIAPAVGSHPERPARGHYEQSCQVHGEVLVGDEQLMIEGAGQRYHSWGVQDWWSSPWCRASGTLADGTAFASWVTGESEGGYLATPAGATVAHAEVHATGGTEGVVVGGDVRLGGLLVAASPIAQAPVSLDGLDGRRARLLRALCRYRSDDGRDGAGWMEWLEPG